MTHPHAAAPGGPPGVTEADAAIVRAILARHPGRPLTMTELAAEVDPASLPPNQTAAVAVALGALTLLRANEAVRDRREGQDWYLLAGEPVRDADHLRTALAAVQTATSAPPPVGTTVDLDAFRAQLRAEAAERDQRNAAELSAIRAEVQGVLGAIMQMLPGSAPAAGPPVCPACGTEVQSRFCPDCGAAPVPSGEVRSTPEVSPPSPPAAARTAEPAGDSPGLRVPRFDDELPGERWQDEAHVYTIIAYRNSGGGLQLEMRELICQDGTWKLAEGQNNYCHKRTAAKLRSQGRALARGLTRMVELVAESDRQR